MAGDWTRIRDDLEDSPRFLRLATLLKIADPDLLVGKMRRFWKWAGKISKDGALRGVTLDMIDARIGLAGFAEALADKDVDWVREMPGGSGVCCPEWAKYNGNSSKKRALDAIRAAKYRARLVTRRVTASRVTERDGLGTVVTPRKREQSSREQRRKDKDIACSEPSRDTICSLLLARAPAIGADGAGLLGNLRAATRAQTEWALERYEAESKRQAIDSPVAYLRRLIEREKPPRGWTEVFNRRLLSQTVKSLPPSGVPNGKVQEQAAHDDRPGRREAQGPAAAARQEAGAAG